MPTNAVAYPLVWRIFSALLIAMSRASLPFLLIAVLTRTSSITTQMLIRAFTILFAVPGIAAWLVECAFAATVGVTDDTLAIARPERRVEIPPRAIARITPWIVPLPGSGLWVHLRSGRRYGLQVSDPSPLLKALAEMCGTTAPLDHPSVIYARAKHSWGSWRSYHL